MSDDRELRLRLKSAARSRLLSKISSLHRQIHTPLSDIVRDHALPHLPVRSLLRLRSVSSSWSHAVSSPLFSHLQSSTHRAISGLFLPSSQFLPFPPSSAHSLPSSSLPPIVSSSNGLLLLSNGPTTLHVTNPATNQSEQLPDPPTASDTSAAVLVYKTGPFNFRPDYSVVVPFRIDPAGRIFGFRCFSSSAGVWWASNEVVAAENLVPFSGVAAGGRAYWKTTMQTVVRYDPATDSATEIAWPMNYSEDVDWRIGCALGDRVFCTAVTEGSVYIFKLLDALNGWVLAWEGEVRKGAVEGLAGFRSDGRFVFRDRPVPLWFQSGEYEFLFAVCGRVMGLDLARKTVRWAEFYYLGSDVEWDRCFSHISTLADVVPVSIVDDENFRVREGGEE